jgi:uncharacterized protein YggU (UPF0235/DUF167 family)
MFWCVVGDAVAVAVKVQPRARHPGLRGSVPDVAGERLAIGVPEPAEDGRANRAACAALAAAVGVSPSRVEVSAGAASRRKTQRISGDAAAIATSLATL